MPFFFYDYYYLVLVIPAMLLALWAQFKVKSTFHRYSQVRSYRGVTAAQVARSILDENGLHNVSVQHVPGKLSDHYDPTSRVVRLSDDVYNSTSIAAIGVAAHEVGHACQHAVGYAPMKLRTAIIPVTNIGSQLAVPLILIGFLFNNDTMAMLGVIFFSTAAIFQLVTLPVEFNASNRAVKTLDNRGFLVQEELSGVKKVLTAAALTYVAALIVSVAQLLRLMLIVGSRRRND
ncbi:MAG: zinc metallopeptidase [Angelakisella sp.]|nr:zinc metallopeptidase [Angelakisella sp.]